MLEETVDQPTLKLVEAKSVKKFIQQRHRSLSSISSLHENGFFSEITPFPSEISELLHEFSDVFVEPKQFPPERSHDHTIPLEPNA